MGARGIETIVVGVDGSEQSAAALGWAIRMAQGMGSEVIAVYSIAEPIWFVESYVTIPPPQFDPEWRSEMKKAFEEHWCKPLKDAGVKFRAIMEDGRPASVINDIADRVNADVIILGRRGRGGVAELVLGSVSHELVLQSNRAVLLIPHHKDGA
jgi:nucleotide-binding universal stress UspA family protein